jgi:hypothetical protein
VKSTWRAERTLEWLGLGAGCLLASCSADTATGNAEELGLRETAAPATQIAPDELIATFFAGPGASAGMWPSWSSGPRPTLLWTEATGDDGSRLLAAGLDQDSWALASTVADGRDWFVNWADMPQVAVASERSMLATWLQKTSPGTYDYQIMFARSHDRGSSWGEAQRLHSAVIPAEYGFVTLTPLPGDRYAAVWLDGRFTAQAKAKGESPAAMSLMTGVITRGGAVRDEHVLDTRVCDCCSTHATLLDSGELLVVYRDRDEQEVRDISFVRGRPGQPDSWSQPISIHRDNWIIPGCPVNGPRVVSSADEVVVAWYALEDNQHPRVWIARSADAGHSFGEPLRIDEGNAQGRVDLAYLGDGSLVVTWLGSERSTANWYARRIEPDGDPQDSIVIAEASGARSDGFLRLATHRDGLLAAFQSADPGGFSIVRLSIDGTEVAGH